MFGVGGSGNRYERHVWERVFEKDMFGKAMFKQQMFPRYCFTRSRGRVEYTRILCKSRRAGLSNRREGDPRSRAKTLFVFRVIIWER